MPRTFLSYRNESDQHAQRVRQLALALERAGVDAVLDVIEDERKFQRGGPDEGWGKWSADQVRDCERVLIVASPGWFREFTSPDPSAATGKGAACEAKMIRNHLYDAKFVTKKVRIVFFDVDDIRKIPSELNDYHRFHGENDLSALVQWLTGKAPEATQLGGATPVVWPPQDLDFEPEFAGRREEWAIARGMLARHDGIQILLVQGACGQGKSRFLGTLVRYAEKQLGRESAALVDCRSCDLLGLLGQFAEELHGAMLPQFLGGEVREAPRFTADLRAINRPLLLAIDHFESATTAIRGWVEQQLVLCVRKNPWLRVAIGGQEVPDLDRDARLQGLVRAAQFRGIFDAASWAAYAACLQLEIQRDAIARWIQECDGDPVAIDRQIRKAAAPSCAPAPPWRPAREDLLAALSVPHWFDLRTIRVLFQIDDAKAKAVLDDVVTWPEIESFSGRGEYCVRESIRRPARKELLARAPERVRQLVALVLPVFEGDQPGVIAERLFLRLHVAGAGAGAEIYRYVDASSRRGSPEHRELLRGMLSEALDDLPLDEPSQACVALAIAVVSRTRLSIVQREGLVRRAIGSFSERGEAWLESDARWELGQILGSRGDRAGAQREFEAGKAILLRLSERDPQNADLQRELSVSHNLVGCMLEARGDRAGAQREFEADKAIMLRLSERDPQNADWQRDLSVSHNQVGRMLEARGDREGAQREFEAGKAIRLRLSVRDPQNADWQCDLSVSHNHVGRMLEARGDRAGALREFEASVGIMRKLAKLDPNNARWRTELAAIESWIAHLR